MCQGLLTSVILHMQSHGCPKTWREPELGGGGRKGLWEQLHRECKWKREVEVEVEHCRALRWHEINRVTSNRDRPCRRGLLWIPRVLGTREPAESRVTHLIC